MQSGAKIKVMENCTCNATRWFYCECAEVLASYVATGSEWQIGDSPAPTQKFVDYVRANHPGVTLVYIDLLS